MFLGILSLHLYFLILALTLLPMELPRTSIILVGRVDGDPWVIWGLFQRLPCTPKYLSF